MTNPAPVTGDDGQIPPNGPTVQARLTFHPAYLGKSMELEVRRVIYDDEVGTYEEVHLGLILKKSLAVPAGTTPELLDAAKAEVQGILRGMDLQLWDNNWLQEGDYALYNDVKPLARMFLDASAQRIGGPEVDPEEGMAIGRTFGPARHPLWTGSSQFFLRTDAEESLYGLYVFLDDVQEDKDAGGWTGRMQLESGTGYILSGWRPFTLLSDRPLSIPFEDTTGYGEGTFAVELRAIELYPGQKLLTPPASE